MRILCENILFCASDVSNVLINSVKSLLHDMEKKFFQKKLQIVFTPCFLFWTLIDEGEAWGKNVFFQVFKKMEKSCTWCIFEKKREFFEKENQKCQ